MNSLLWLSRLSVCCVLVITGMSVAVSSEEPQVLQLPNTAEQPSAAPRAKKIKKKWRRVVVEDELYALAKQHKIVIVGVDKTADIEASVANEPLPLKFKRLLHDFNYMEERDDAGRLSRLIILGQKGAPADHSQRTVVTTEGEGRHHKVKVVLTGVDGSKHTAVLMVDTGADVVVLADTMIAALKIDKASLSEQEIQTANGKTTALRGKLPAVEIKDQKVEQVDVAFLPKDKLGSSQLLGMSVLEKFKVTLDDLNGEMTLEPNQPDASKPAE